MFVFIPGSISPGRFGPAGTSPSGGSISPVTYIHKYLFFFFSIFLIEFYWFRFQSIYSSVNTGSNKKNMLSKGDLVKDN